MADNTEFSIDPDDVTFNEDGSIESMTDPDTGELVKADPKPEEAREPDGPYDNTNAEGNKPGDDHHNPENPETVAGADEFLLDTLAAYGFEDDAIEWNGEPTRVSELDPEERREFFAELRARDRAEAANLTPEEQELLAVVREGGDLRQALGLASEGPATGAATLDADALNRVDIRQQFPGLSDEEVEEELAERKTGARYETKTGALRERMQTQEQAAAAAADAQEYEQYRQEFVESANKLTDVMGFPVEKAVRDHLLARTTTREANGASPFVNSLTPEKALRLEFLDTYLPQIDAYYRNEVAEGVKRGRAEALGTAPRQPSGRGSNATNRSQAGANSGAKQADYVLGED